MAMNSIPYEFLKPLNMAFDLLGRSNIKYFDGKDSGFKKYWRFLYVVPCALTHFIFETLYVISLLTSDSPTSEISWMIPVYLILFQGIIKATVVCIKKTEIETIVEGLGAIWRTDERLTRNQIEKKQYRLKNFNFCLTVFYWGSMAASYQNLFTTICIILFKRLVLQQDPELEFAFGNTYPYDFTKNWFTYLLVYSFQIFSVLRFIYVYMGTECLMISLCSQMSTDFALLQEDLKCIVVNKNGHKEISQFTTSQTTIEDIVSHHQKLISLVKILNMIFNQLVCLDFVFATVLICFFCFGASVAPETTEFLKNFSAALALMGPIYILCYYAEQLQEESAGIANAAYETLWYEGDKTFQKNIFLIILRSQRACCLTSLNYAPISLNSFTKIISTSYSYYSLIRTMYADE